MEKRGQCTGRNRIYPFQITRLLVPVGTRRSQVPVVGTCHGGTTTLHTVRFVGILREKRRQEKRTVAHERAERLKSQRGRVEERKMETLDFSCSSRKREEVDGKALAGDKTVLSSPFRSFSFFFPHLPHLSSIVSSFLLLVCTSVSFIATKYGAFLLSCIQILCAKKRSIHFRKCGGNRRDGDGGRVSKRV